MSTFLLLRLFCCDFFAVIFLLRSFSFDLFGLVFFCRNDLYDEKIFRVGHVSCFAMGSEWIKAVV